MSGRLRLVVFDVDGTLVDSQGSILSAMAAAFDAVGRTAPAREEVLGIVGLSLDHAMQRLAPAAGAADRDALVTAYKKAYFDQRMTQGEGGSPLFPGAAEVLRQLADWPDLLLGVATGKSRRGLDALLAQHGLGRAFVTRQVADDHPSKPHPSMLLAAMAETGTEPGDAVMIGDTSFDMEMAAAAGVAGIGVSWGYHPREQLHTARLVIERFEDLPDALHGVWNKAT